MLGMTRTAGRAMAEVFTFCKHLPTLPARGGTLTMIVYAIVDGIVSFHKRSPSTFPVNVPPCRRHGRLSPAALASPPLPPARAGSAARECAACRGRREAAFRAMPPAKPHGARVARPTGAADGPGRACRAVGRLDAARVRHPLPPVGFASLRVAAARRLARPAARLSALAPRLCRAAQVCAALACCAGSRVTDFPRHVRCLRNGRAGGFGLLAAGLGLGMPARGLRPLTTACLGLDDRPGKPGGKRRLTAGVQPSLRYGLTRSPGGGKPPATAAGAGAPAARRAPDLLRRSGVLLAAPAGPPAAPPHGSRPLRGALRRQAGRLSRLPVLARRRRPRPPVSRHGSPFAGHATHRLLRAALAKDSAARYARGDWRGMLAHPRHGAGSRLAGRPPFKPALWSRRQAARAVSTGRASRRCAAPLRGLRAVTPRACPAFGPRCARPACLPFG
jgi:hypothetical protein